LSEPRKADELPHGGLTEDCSAVAPEWTLVNVQARLAQVVSFEEILAYLRSLPP
jgi:hypothetical protein